MKKPEYVNISYKMAARYLVSNYMRGIYSPLKVVAYPDAKKVVTPSDGCPSQSAGGSTNTSCSMSKRYRRVERLGMG